MIYFDRLINKLQLFNLKNHIFVKIFDIVIENKSIVIKKDQIPKFNCSISNQTKTTVHFDFRIPMVMDDLIGNPLSP